jgi:hypothetical protein
MASRRKKPNASESDADHPVDGPSASPLAPAIPGQVNDNAVSATSGEDIVMHAAESDDMDVESLGLNDQKYNIETHNIRSKLISG